MNDISSADKRVMNFMLVIFMLVLVFQFTALKFIWGLEQLSKIVNLALLVLASLYFLISIVENKFNKRIYYFYIIPGLLLYYSLFYNIAVNAATNFSIVGQFGFLLPVAFYLAMPQVVKSKKFDSMILWRFYYYFFCLGITLGVAEYLLILNNIESSRQIQTSGGIFVGGYFTILVGLIDGTYYYRFHAFFLEPGSLAMYLLPAISYAVIYRRYWGLFIFIPAFFLADSLGGYVGIALLALLLAFTELRHRFNLQTMFLILLPFLLIMTLFSQLYIEPFTEAYVQKQISNSATEREDNLLNFIPKLPNLIIKYPFGLPLTESTELSSQNKDYFGSTFALGNAFARGGIFALIGYTLLLVVSFTSSIIAISRKGLTKEEKVVSSTLIAMIPFILQREVVWDTAIFALLFAPTILRQLSRQRLR